jgi:hypothetical protein
MSLHFFERFSKSILCAAGAVLLLMISERCGPWGMCNIRLQDVPPDFVVFRFLHFDSFGIGYYYFIGLCYTLLPATAFLFRSARSSAAYLFRNKSELCFFSSSFIVFFIMFIPGFFRKEIWEMPVCSVALYLTLGLYGTCFFLMGISGYIADLGLWERLRSFILSVKLPWFLSILFIAEFLVTNLISYFAFEHIPHIQDSFAQVFHGAIFAAGHLTAPAPPLQELFYYDNIIINNGQWYSQYPPGHSFLMMLGILAGAPWIINPLAGSATVVLLYFLGREIYSDPIGRLASLLGLLSPFILFMSSEFMNHATALFMFTVFMLFYARTLRLHSILSALMAGAALGWIINIRPLTAVTLGLPFMVYATWLLMKRFKQHRLPFLAMSSMVLTFIGILLVFNQLTNGDPLLFGYQVLHGTEHLPGFGPAPWGEPHTVGLGILHTLNNFVGLNKHLFEWPIPSLAFVFILFAAGRVNRWDVLLIGSFLCLSLGYVFYWYQDWCFGPRFVYEASGCMILLTARGIQSVPCLIKNTFGRPVPVKRVSGLTTALIVFCMAYGLITNVPALYKLYNRSYWGVDGKLPAIVHQKGVQKAIIFIGCIRNRPLMANSPFLDNNIIYSWDSIDQRKELMDLFPGYRYFFEKEENNLEEIFSQ